MTITDEDNNGMSVKSNFSVDITDVLPFSLKLEILIFIKI